MTDRQLLERFTARSGGHCEGAEGAFAELVRRHGAMVLGTCRQWLQEPHDAEDAFQATFLVLARRAGTVRKPELLGPWLYGVAVRVSRKARSLNERRRRHEGREVAMGHDEPVGDTGRHELRLVRREEIEALHEELALLPENYRVPVVLCDLGGLTHAQAAERLRWPSGSLSVRLMRARELLRRRLTRRGLSATSVMLATAALPETASASVPQELAAATAKAAVRFATGGGPATAGVSASASALSGHVLNTISLTELISGGILMVAGMVAVTLGLGWLAWEPADRPSGSPDAPQTGTTRPSDSTRSPSPTLRPAQLNSAPAVAHLLGFADRSPQTVLPESSRTVASGPVSEEARAAYPELAKNARRDADAQVKLALWCEAHGLTAERFKHLALAVLTEPGHATARGLLGQMFYAGRWRRPEAVGDLVRADTSLSSALAVYNGRRERTPNTADAQWKLGLWCEQNGLKAEATAHFVRVSRLDPENEAAWKRLGCKRVNGRWLNDEQAESDRDEAFLQKEGNRIWRPLLAKWRSWLNTKDRREEAEHALSGVTDPHAVPSVWSVFASGGEFDQRRAVQLFGQIDSPASDLALGIMALSSPVANVRKVACETLSRRDARQALGLLVGLLRDPDPNPSTPIMRIQVIPIGALGTGSPGINLVEGRRFTSLGVYGVDETSLRTSFGGLERFTELLRTGAPGYANRIMWQRQRQLNDLEVTVRSFLDEAFREVLPVIASVRQGNARVIETLKNIVGVSPGDSWEDWKRWWVEQQGYAYDPGRFKNPPDLADEPKPVIFRYFHYSCFGAGTLVRTRTGTQPIESVRVGDQVLTQDVRRGALSFAPVLAALHNNPTLTLRIELDGVTTPIVATDIHRFWKAGRGWVMARDLKPGDALRTLEGPVRVSAVSLAAVQPVFNLEVGECQSFFVGPTGVLVHDNSAVQPVVHPFDEVPEYR